MLLRLSKLEFVQWPDRLLARQDKAQECQQCWTSSRDCVYALHLAVIVGIRPTVPVKSAFASSCRHDSSIALSVPVSARLMQHAESTMHFIMMSKHAEITSAQQFKTARFSWLFLCHKLTP